MSDYTKLIERGRLCARILDIGGVEPEQSVIPAVTMSDLCDAVESLQAERDEAVRWQKLAEGREVVLIDSNNELRTKLAAVVTAGDEAVEGIRDKWGSEHHDVKQWDEVTNDIPRENEVEI